LSLHIGYNDPKDLNVVTTGSSVQNAKLGFTKRAPRIPESLMKMVATCARTVCRDRLGPLG